MKCVSCLKETTYDLDRGNYCEECDRRAELIGLVVAKLSAQKEVKEKMIEIYEMKIVTLKQEIYLIDKELRPIVKGNLV